MKIKKLIINRNKWGQRHLLNEDGEMCCLGFLAIACGALPEEIYLEVSPSNVPNIDWPAEFIALGGVPCNNINNSIITNSAINANDDNTITWTEREKQLKTIFKMAGIELRFTGKKKAAKRIM